MDRQAVDHIVGQYEKHGWHLHRVLLTPALAAEVNGASDFSVDLNLNAVIDGLWFSRPRSDGRVAWEFRHLSDSPFALVAVVEAAIDDEELDRVLAAAELKMHEAVYQKTG